MRRRLSRLLVLFALGVAASSLAACSDGATGDAQGSSGGTGGTGGVGVGGDHFNQCGVAAPLPAETGQCTVISAPAITDFDDYAGGTPASYTFSLDAAAPSEAMTGAILHVGDGSDMNGGTGVITTEMVTGEGDAGYALQIANTNAMTWGGLLTFYFPYAGETPACLDASAFQGLEFSIKGTSPSGRFGASLGMLDTIPSADKGLCNNATTSDCKDANVELTLPADATTWMHVQVPWGTLTPGIGSETSCIPVTGQNVVRLVIQPFMSYPPPDYTFEPGAYAIAVDNLRFY